MSISLFGMAGPTDHDLGLTTLTSFALHTSRAFSGPQPPSHAESQSQPKELKTLAGGGGGGVAAEAPEQKRGGSSGIPSSRADTGPGRATGGEGDDAEADPVQGAEQEEDRPSQPPRQGAPRSQRYACRNRLRRPPLLD